ncbi:sensor histidine kinase KdpD [Prevotella sp. MA2016]|uniref:sensor histidine kinase n=1 Tax=Prevotella sp. MA2016 TaxID=1408310 RepID=UPI0018CC20B6|nr:HAMP domain-containing sensor histidine kinase [Prevotella sp. MA2016]
MMLLGAVSTVYTALYMYQLKKARKRLFLSNAMLETNYHIMEMSHQEQQETLEKLTMTNAMLETNYHIMEMSHKELMDSLQQLTEANERAQESSKMKSNFIQQISHEIRTPLNILSGFTQIITMPGVELSDDEKIQIKQGIVENTDRITGLVNKMLDLSDANSQSVINRTDQTTAVELTGFTISKAGIAEQKDVNFELEMTNEVGATPLLTHIDTASRALSLLLDNAIKYSAKSAEKQVRLCVTTTDESVVFAVEDRGIGVPAEEAEHIFEEFVQLDEYYDGTGIGLTIARSQARRLGGDIVLDTTYAPGARFVMTLPR